MPKNRLGRHREAPTGPWRSVISRGEDRLLRRFTPRNDGIGKRFRQPVRHIGPQLIRAATSIGANYAEAQAAESKADFAHKLQISLKECRESHYWLKLLSVRQAGSKTTLAQLLDESGQLGAILSRSILTAKSRP